jgi:multimeric flavodoxin WrbA
MRPVAPEARRIETEAKQTPDILQACYHPWYNSYVILNIYIIRITTGQLKRRGKMRVVSLLGSPRENGNSSTVARRFCDTAETLGAEVRTFTLNKLQYRGCQGCMLCKTKLDRCALQDDLTEVLEAVRGADVVVVASPVYFWDVSSQVKTFIDRTFSFLVPDFYSNAKKARLEPGKKLVFILTQTNPDPKSFPDIFTKFDYFFKMYGFSESHLIRAFGVSEPGQVKSQEDVMRLAETTARKLCSA